METEPPNLNPTGHTHGPITQTQNSHERHSQDKPRTRPHTPTHTPATQRSPPTETELTETLRLLKQYPFTNEHNPRGTGLAQEQPWLYKLALQEIGNATVGLCQKLPPDLCQIIGVLNYMRVEEELIALATRWDHLLCNNLGYNLIRMPSFDYCKTQEMSCSHCRRWHWVCDCPGPPELCSICDLGADPACGARCNCGVYDSDDSYYHPERYM